MSNIPGITIIPKNKFDLLNAFLVMIGSKTEIKNEINAMQLTATDALANFTAPYQATQCKVKIIPIPPIVLIFLNESVLIFSTIFGINNITTETIKTRYQTKGNSLIEMSLPKIAVKPQRNVVICLFCMLRIYVAYKSLTSFAYYF